jgi:hypothetical protein
MDKELEQLLAQWLTATNEGNVKNKIGERIAELCAHAKLEEKYASRLQSALLIPRRGEEGVVILDIVYKLDDGRIIFAESKFNQSKRGKVNQLIYAVDDEVGAAQVLTVEGGITQLDPRWTLDRIKEIEKKNARLAREFSIAADNGNLIVLEIRSVPEVSGGKAVIKEIQVTDETQTFNNFKRGISAKLSDKQKAVRSLGKKLAFDRSPAEHAEWIAKYAKKEKEKAKFLRKKANAAQKEADSEVKEDIKKIKNEIAKKADEAAKKAENEVVRATAEAEQEYIRLAGIGQLDKDALEKAAATAKSKAVDLRKKADTAAEDAKKAAAKVEEAKDYLKKAPENRPDWRRIRTERLQDAEELAKEAGHDAERAKELAEKAELEYKQLTGSDLQGTGDPMKSSPATEAKISGKPPEKPLTLKDAPDIHTRRSSSSKAVESKAVDTKGTNARGIVAETDTAVKIEDTAGSAIKAKSAIKVLGDAEEVVSKAGKARFVVELAFRGASVIGKIGKFVFTFLEVSGLNLLGDILLLIDAIDFIFGWLNRKEIQKQKEWKRIIGFLFGDPLVIKGLYNITYMASIRPAILSIMERKLRDDSYTRNFLFWLEKWNTDKDWEGFVYVEVHIPIEKQARLQSDPDEGYNCKYYGSGTPPVINLTDNPVENEFTEKKTGIKGPGEVGNLSTGPNQPPYSDPMYNYGVETSDLDVLFTQPIPCLTPFDFIIIKCRTLFSSVISFISKYDPLISKDTDTYIDENFIEEFLKGDVFKGYKFMQPLNDGIIHYALSLIFWVINYLSRHSAIKSDFDMGMDNINYNKGMFRRQQLLFGLTRPLKEDNNPFRKYEMKTSPFYDLGLLLMKITEGETKRDLVKPIDPEIKDLTKVYLAEFAIEIDNDIKRAFRDTQKRPYQYQYKGAEKTVKKVEGI